MIGLVFVGIGIIALVLVILFKKNINKFYDNMKGLSESHAKYYKNIVVFPETFQVFMRTAVDKINNGKHETRKNHNLYKRAAIMFFLLRYL